MRLSVCMIARNEESCIGNILADCRTFADEIVVYDTGSTDRTIEIARNYGAMVICGEWRDDFAWARNQSIGHATGSWIFVVDCDDRIPYQTQKIVRELKKQPNDRAFIFWMENVGCGDDEYCVHRWKLIKMFPNKKYARYTGRLHEKISEAIVDAGLPRFEVEGAKIEHHGYTSKDVVQKKIRRNCRLQLLGKMPEGVDFFEFSIGPYMFFYTPNVLTMFYRGKEIIQNTPNINDPNTAEINIRNLAKKTVQDFERLGGREAVDSATKKTVDILDAAGYRVVDKDGKLASPGMLEEQINRIAGACCGNR